MIKEDNLLLRGEANKLPGEPGVYQFYNKEDHIIYVGKAKNLKKRVTSYFVKKHDNRKTEILVKQIEKIRFIVVDTEEDALILENNLVKKYQPKYNILLKDDKTFPWICIKNESFPRIFYTRNVIKDGSIYFGPYTSIYMARTILEVIRQLFPVRNCNLLLNQSNIETRKFKKCLEFQIGNCKGPCEALYDKARYDLDILNAKSILSGTLNPVYDHLKAEMKDASERYEFEKANEFKSKIQILENYKSKSLVCSSTVTNLDIFSYLESENTSYINYFRIVNGSIVTTYFLEIKRKLNESKEDILSFGIIEIRKHCNSESTEVVLPFGVGVSFSKMKITIPQIGEKRKLLELCEKNGRFFMLERMKNDSVKSPESRRDSLLEKMQKDLRLTRLPHWIECFDNSNISGEFPVSSCVVFKDGKPHKSQYRHFNVKTVEGSNDFASMVEIVRRRYSRQLTEGNRLPDLILIDGGKGQLSAAYSVLVELGLENQVQMIGIAKKLEELYFPGDSIPLYLDKKSETLMVLQKLRDEAHRFGITFHRNQRSRDFTKSELLEIPGLGPKTVEKLLKIFKSPSVIKNLKLEELSQIVGRDKSERILGYFKKVIN